MAAPKAPQDHLSKATADDGEIITKFTYGEHELTGYGDSVTGESMEHLAAGSIHVFLKDLLGQEQWDKIKKLPVRRLKEVLEAWGEAAKAAGNS